MRSESPELELEPEEPTVRLVGDLAVPTSMHYVRVEAVGLVTGLKGTGSDPGPSPQRAALLEEMQARGVANPNAVLASGDVSLVLVTGILRPGVQKGDRFDIEIRVPSQSETASLRGGYLLETRLTEMAVLGNQVRHGNLLALAKGPVMIDPTADPKKDRVLACRGRVLGGGLALKSRPLALVLTPEHQSVMNSSRIAVALNKRFHSFEGGVKSGVAKAKTDELVELTVQPRYKEDVNRFIKVVQSVPISESAPERMERIAALREKLLEPTTAAEAAIQLEAIGSEGADTLLKGIESKDPEVRFYAAEALAYLDRREAAAPLGEIARNQPAFRVFALNALSAMQEYAACEQLRELLSSPSAETRYGAFRALWANNAKDPLVKGESLGGQFNYHVLDVGGPPMIHVTRSRVSEVVVFGPGQQLHAPLALNAGNEIMVTASEGGEVTVSKYSVKDGDQKRTVSTRVDDVIRAIVELGGTYPDVVQALQEAKNLGALPARFEVDSLPEAGRTYERTAQDDQDEEEPEDEAAAADDSESDSDSDPESETDKGFFARMIGR